ncbi:sodium-coupled monocarboxylate transporter 1 isoform X2 [Patella vulgata]|uniref:sodium-coupled monocarboxylate transporter 1 isoform X1 n=1 Tax=Patella vulgata TaxID=6465 RepID=UPI00217FE4AE|nr:sodium-coupled monocarboxylate transporter 1 isoform X1 [Patella vulgata]XP_050390984.1 sodium-coupled monocarboxylate transporter 1 isoform X2 [Patella vulgata]
MAERLYSYQTGSKHTFTWIDYFLFVCMLLVSAGIGIFYAIKDRKKNTTKDFLLAGGNMSVFPVALSLLASFMSAITLLGTPAEMYNYTTMYWWIGVSYFFAIFAAAHIYIPIFYRLGVTSAFEYLDKRFGRIARVAAACTYVTQMTIYMAIVLYAPSLALNAVTGVTLWGLIWTVGAVCIFYTAIGGMKAVLWTDTFQTGLMLAGLLAILIQGSIEVGGFAKAWDISAANERILFSDFSVDPSVRHSFWSLTIGGAFVWIYVYGTNQAQIQRTITCPSLRKARIAIWLNLPGLWVVLYLSCLIGTVIYAFYRTCDPKTFNLITASDQLLPLFVMDVLGHIPGLPGLFVACIFSGALSTISSGLNSISAVILQDIIKNLGGRKITEKRATIISKVLAVVFGILMIGLTYVASLLGGVLQAALALYGMIGGPIMGIFTLGMLFPWANQKGAVTGLVTSLILMFWIGIGYQVHRPIVATPSPISLVDCNWNLTTTTPAVTPAMNMSFINSTAPTVTDGAGDSDPLVGLYTLSYMWYTATAVLTVIVVGLIVSFITGATKPESLDPTLICPFFDIVFPCLPEKILKPLRFGIDFSHVEDDDFKTRVLKDSFRKNIKVNYTPEDQKADLHASESGVTVTTSGNESTPTLVTTVSQSALPSDELDKEKSGVKDDQSVSTHL